MSRKMRFAPVILCGTVLTGSLYGCGKASETTATESPATATETTTQYYGDNADEYACTEAEPSDSYVPVNSSKNIFGNNNEETFVYEDAEECADVYGCYPDYFYTEPNTESYDKPEENGYNLVATNPLSTFAADVDTASYTNIRRMIEDGYTLNMIDTQAVRPEEFINYFSYNLNDPGAGEKFGITTEISKCPWNEDHELMFVGMKTREIDLEEAPMSNLVFLIDVSGSMSDENKLPLLQKSFKELVDNLPDKGTISIVTYSGCEKVVLSGESMSNKKKLKKAIDSLVADGCTNGEAGIQKAYEIAKDNYIENGINRVILATDGDLNVGISSPAELERFIEDKKDDGVFLSVLGFGDGNYKDDRLEKLADCGNGNYSYIDSFYEGKKVLVDEMGSTLITIAKDVKYQVEFNPGRVNAYRLIGYENRLMDDADFNDDTKDGGEIGAGHSVVALYEIIPVGSKSEISLKYQNGKQNVDTCATEFSDEYATVSVRYKEPDADKSKLFSIVVNDSAYDTEGSENIRFAGMVAEFAMILGDSEFKGTATYDDILDNYKKLSTRDEYRDEFNQLVRMMAKRS
ncbi:vWA domain-containing protein [Butyrivibrio sp. MB2005]|uniref:vWA domain-containing protein n=1 Tax=Butyrivibrio sp. MB2005 TaxID=1280678 RepID=UPI000420311A|nr:VWA domain-containing protein [Butyrivibrio sp. MB2005]